jgi:hypothetical protein
VVTVVSSDDTRPYGEALLRPYKEAPLPGGGAAVAVVLAKGDARLSDVVAGYAESSGADLVVCGSHHLCKRGEAMAPLALPAGAQRAEQWPQPVGGGTSARP